MKWFIFFYKWILIIIDFFNDIQKKWTIIIVAKMYTFFAY